MGREIGFQMATSNIRFGAGVTREVGMDLTDMKLGRVLVVIDPGLRELPPVTVALQAMEDEGIAFSVFDRVRVEPTDRSVQEAIAAARGDRYDGFVAIGGGSTIDTAKAANLYSTFPADFLDYVNAPIGKGLPVPGSLKPLVAIPTTAGTGSEVTRGVAITDPDRDVKMLLMSSHLVPAAAIVDPEPTYTMPPGVTASTGLDALTHGIEAYVSRRRFPITDALAIDAIDRIGRFMARAYHHPDDAEAREEMLVGSLHAGLAFNNASVALVHGMSRPIGAYFHVPHGLSNAMLLPTVMEFSLGGDIPRYARVARVLGATETDDHQAAEAGVAIIRNLAADLQVPTLRAWGVNEARFRQVTPAMARDALASGSPANNPRPATVEEIESLYEAVITL